MDDRRAFERREAALQAEVTRVGSGEVVGLLADISSGGMMLRTEGPLPAGRRLQLRIEAPGAGEQAGPLDVEVAVRWSEPDLDPATHLVGLEFVGKTPPRSAVIEALRRQLGQVR